MNLVSMLVQSKQIDFTENNKYSLTCSMFSSISSSRASLVILATKAPLGISTPGAGAAPPPPA